MAKRERVCVCGSGSEKVVLHCISVGRFLGGGGGRRGEAERACGWIYIINPPNPKMIANIPKFIYIPYFVRINHLCPARLRGIEVQLIFFEILGFEFLMALTVHTITV